MVVDEQNLSWINALGIFESNQDDLPVGRSFPLEIAMSPLPNFPNDGFDASTTDVSRHQLRVNISSMWLVEVVMRPYFIVMHQHFFHVCAWLK